MRNIVRIGIMLLLFGIIVNIAGCDGDNEPVLMIPDTGVVEHGCDWSENLSESRPADFNILFRYGDVGYSELNTFNGTYTKYLGPDPSVTIDLILTSEDLDRIYQKVREIEFFCYPDEFVIPFPEGTVVSSKPDNQVLYFKVVCDGLVKAVRWNDYIYQVDEDARNLRRLAGLIMSIIRSKDVYWELPSSTGIRI